MRLKLGAAVLAMGLVLTSTAVLAPAGAGWLSRIAREAAETGSTGAKLAPGLGALDGAATMVARLPKLPNATAVAGHLTPEGHWKFVNRDGHVFTAATPEEIGRLRAALAPEAATGDRLALYLSEDSVFAGPGALKALPAEADLHIVAGKDAYRLRRSADGTGLAAAEVRPNIVVTLTSRPLFEETLARLARPLNGSSMRVLALETAGPRRLSSVPRFDPATKAALVDQVDPMALPEALSALRGQTAVVSGRVEGSVLKFRPSSGPEQSLDIATLVRAAEEADVNLVLIGGGAAHQPGGRNWLWQRVAVAGLDDALTRATFADFMAALGEAGSELTIKAAPGTHGRVVLSAVPVPARNVPLSDTLGDWIGEITGHVAVKSVEVFARDDAQERELDARIVPGIPSGLQFFYLGAVVVGLLAWPVSLAWWARLWPKEERHEYAGRMGYLAARAVRLLVFLALFLPIAGFPAMAWTGLVQIWAAVTVPFRFAGRMVKWLRA